jgi:hypothetical protein
MGFYIRAGNGRWEDDGSREGSRKWEIPLRICAACYQPENALELTLGGITELEHNYFRTGVNQKRGATHPKNVIH